MIVFEMGFVRFLDMSWVLRRLKHRQDKKNTDDETTLIMWSKASVLKESITSSNGKYIIFICLLCSRTRDSN